MKRTLSLTSLSDDVFDITKYNLDCLENLIQLIRDYKSMKLPSKRHRINYPSKMYLLPDLLPELNELNDMIGLHKFKKQIVDKIIFFIQSHENNIMLHTVLEGAPGTGKTTVSNILAKIYSKLGIFKKPKFNIVRRADLISEYLGGTTIKTLETLERCKKGVMLIDEAYSIGSKSTNEDSYAKECIDTLNQYLTENVDKIICIIAGYKSELDSCFFSMNPGLRRRFPWTFTIENYTSYELSQIYFNLIDEKEWDTSCKISEINDLISKNVSLFTGNGGDISNIIEKAIIINMRNNFGKQNLYTINIEEFKEALGIFICNKKTSDLPPFGMYN